LGFNSPAKTNASLCGAAGGIMKKQRIRIDDLSDDAAAELTADDVQKVTGGMAPSNGPMLKYNFAFTLDGAATPTRRTATDTITYTGLE
jgi:hypothetical protein